MTPAAYRDACRDQDHYDTPRAAYELIAPFVPPGATLWDPFYNTGRCADTLRAVFPDSTVIHENRDALSWSPDCDVIVCNPPFSAKYDWLQWLLDGRRAFAVLLPMATLSAAKFAALRGHDTVQLVIPSKRLHYERDGAVVKGCSFESVWVTRGLALPRDVVWA